VTCLCIVIAGCADTSRTESDQQLSTEDHLKAAVKAWSETQFVSPLPKEANMHKCRSRKKVMRGNNATLSTGGHNWKSTDKLMLLNLTN
jgi:hypothetical protein